MLRSITKNPEVGDRIAVSNDVPLAEALRTIVAIDHPPLIPPTRTCPITGQTVAAPGTDAFSTLHLDDGPEMYASTIGSITAWIEEPS